MKKRILVTLAVFMLAVGACGGGGGGGGGGLTPAQVALIYELANSGTPVPEAVVAILEQIYVDRCSGGTLDLSALGGTCDNGGTWALGGTLNCSVSGTDPNLTVTMSSTDNGQLVLSNCNSTIEDNAATKQDAAGLTSIVLDGTIDPFAFTNTTIDVDFTNPDDPTILMNGSLTETYSNMALSGGLTATTSFTQNFTLTNFDFESDVGVSCAQNVVNATQGGESGTCQIQTDCMDCL